MLTGKQRAYLKKLAIDLEPSVYIGKNELTDNIIKETDNYLEAHELVKVKLHILGMKSLSVRIPIITAMVVHKRNCNA